jgi:hypothetical protein
MNGVSMRPLGRVCVVSLVLALGVVPAPDDSPAPTAYELFARARDALQKQSHPEPIFYRTTIHVSEGSKQEFEHFRAEALSSGDVRVEGVSEEEQATPHQSDGVNFKLKFSIGWNTGAGGQTESASEDAHRKETPPDYLGVPLISPSYWFGLSSYAAEGSSPGLPGGSTIPTIATVTAASRVYRVSIVGMETVSGLYTYHLSLSPTVFPDRYRVRALWVDASTYQIVALQTLGNFTNPPMSSVPWLITFQNLGGSVYIKDEIALAPLVFRHDRTFSNASISFDEIRTTDTGPPFLPTMDGGACVNLREPPY